MSAFESDMSNLIGTCVLKAFPVILPVMTGHPHVFPTSFAMDNISPEAIYLLEKLTQDRQAVMNNTARGKFLGRAGGPYVCVGVSRCRGVECSPTPSFSSHHRTSRLTRLVCPDAGLCDGATAAAGVAQLPGM